MRNEGMNRKNLLMAAVLLTGLSACNNSSKTPSASDDTVQDVEILGEVVPIAPQMTGTFRGVLPAASSEGIRTELTLNADSTYTYVQEYIGEKDAKFETSGVYHLLGTDLIELVTPSSGEKTYYKRVESGFMLSDSLGTVNKGELAEHYVLKLSE